MRGHASISFWHFVFRGPGPSRPVGARGFGVFPSAVLFPLLAAALCNAGCARQGGIRPVEDTETSGRISIAASPDAQSLLSSEAAAFRSTYPEATLELRPPESSAQVMSALLGGRADTGSLFR